MKENANSITSHRLPSSFEDRSLQEKKPELLTPNNSAHTSHT
jgi:hypothetical protein